MKRIVLTCMMILLTLASGQAKNLTELFEEFKHERRADYVSVSPFVMTLARWFVPAGEEGAEFVRHIRSVRVLDLEDCPNEVKQRFDREVKTLDTDGYEEMMRVKDEGETARVLVKRRKEVIREMLVICTGGDDCTLVALTGKIHQDDIRKIVEQHTKDDKDEC